MTLFAFWNNLNRNSRVMEYPEPDYPGPGIATNRARKGEAWRAARLAVRKLTFESWGDGRGQKTGGR
jgi:hypothetical protein